MKFFIENEALPGGAVRPNPGKISEFGPVAQLGAHYIRIVGVGSSNLLRSTKTKRHRTVSFCFYRIRETD